MKNTRTDEAYQAIKELFYHQQLFPGQKIIYRDLEEKLGMSKTPIINGLIKLEQEGLVVSQKNRGFYIKDVSLEDVEWVYDLKQKLEVISLDYAIDNHTKEDLELLKENLSAYREYSYHIYDLKRAKLDKEFHMQIAKMGKNKYFVSILSKFLENIPFKINIFYLSSYIDQFKEEHNVIYDLIKKKNKEKAIEVMSVHNKAATRLLTEAWRYQHKSS